MENKINKTLLAAVVVALGVGLLVYSPTMSKGIVQGLLVCGNFLIPALFPFMVLSGFIATTTIGEVISAPIGFFASKILKIPREMGAVLLLSIIGGYPVGARMLADYYSSGRLDKKTTERMLCFCVNSGPSFVITAVGAQLFLDRTAGLIFFATQIAATFIIGIVVSFRAKAPPKTTAKFTPQKASTAFVLAVSGACTSTITMCGFAVLASGILSVLNAGGFPQWVAGKLSLPTNITNAVIAGVLEVTAGCINGATLGGGLAAVTVSAILSFGGLSVIMQVISCFKDCPINFIPYISSRFVHAIISCSLALPLFERYCKDLSVALVATVPVMQIQSRTVITLVGLVCMCTILLLSIDKTNINTCINRKYRLK